MDKELKKIFTFPFIALTTIVGIISAIKLITDVSKDFKVKTIIVLSIIISSFIYIVIRLYIRIKKDGKTILDLKKNNSGLIEAKDKYLEENVSLKGDVTRYSQENIFLTEENYTLRNILKNIILQSQVWGLDNAEKEVIINFILGGENYERKELESNQDN